MQLEPERPSTPSKPNSADMAPRLNKRELQVALAGVDRRGPAAFAKLAGCFQRERPVSITCDRTSPKEAPNHKMLCRGPLDTRRVSLPATRQVYVSVLVRTTSYRGAFPRKRGCNELSTIMDGPLVTHTPPQSGAMTSAPPAAFVRSQHLNAPKGKSSRAILVYKN